MSIKDVMAYLKSRQVTETPETPLKPHETPEQGMGFQKKTLINQVLISTETPETPETSKNTDSRKNSQILHKTGALKPATEPQDFDRWCWPHGEAMSRREIEVFMKRDSQFQRRGMSAEEAEKLADKLVKRDRDDDDRRLCLECQNLTGRPGAWRCGQQRVGSDCVLLPKRCDSFRDGHR